MEMLLDFKLVFYLAPMALIWAGYLGLRERRERQVAARREAARKAGLTEPASLHPVINTSRCVGCGSCVAACPEGSVLGLLGGKAELVNPSYCIGHGACRLACPMDAITLVFGTRTRGVDIPLVDADFQTNVPGVYIAGELGGMGLIRNAVEQGRQAVEAVRRHRAGGDPQGLDLVIVGAGPAGIAASLAARQHGLRVETLEQDTLGGTVSHYPRGKVVMTAPVVLPIIGKARFTETTKEALLAFWQDVVARTDLGIRFQERVESVTREGDGFRVKTSRAEYRTRAVLLAIGRRGTPRRLGVTGEDLPKVVYRLEEPEQYRGRRVLVVGGGDSALEAALAVAGEPDTAVTLSYRSEAFNRVKDKNRAALDAAAAAGRITVALRSQVQAITPDAVTLAQDGTTRELPNDAVIVCAGGILPTAFLRDIGIQVDTKHGLA